VGDGCVRLAHEESPVAVLHLDHDFDIIAPPMERLDTT
jgi:hypothetical protein